MNDQRKFLRFPLQLSARYTGKKGNNWKECSVIDISREGIGIIIHSKEVISEGILLKLEIHAPVQDDPIMVEGKLIWLKELKDDPQFNYAGDFSGGLAPVTIDRKTAYIDKMGNYVWGPTK